MPDGRKLCPPDYQAQQPRCATCGWTIVGSYVEVQGRIPVCPRCHREHPACFLCSLPVPAGGRRLADGRTLCPEHARQGIFDPDAARLAFAQATEAAASHLGMRLRTPIHDVSLVDARTLSSILARQGKGGGGHVLGLFQLTLRGSERRHTVYLLSGLPRERLVTVALHELAHAWHSENHPRYADCRDTLREGFAEWVSYRVNLALGRQGEAELLKDPRRKEYFQGLRAFLALEQRQGRAGVFRVASTQTQIRLVPSTPGSGRPPQARPAGSGRPPQASPGRR